MSISSLNREFGRLGIFIDGNNLFHAARSMGIEIDYAKFLGVFCNYGPLMRAFFYTGVDESASKQQGFLLWMKRNGYKVVQKELKIFPDGTKRANLDVEIVVDMLSLSNSIDTIILVSGDEDFSYALNHLASHGKQIVVAGFRVNTSPLLLDHADYFLDLEAFLDEIVKDPAAVNTAVSQADFYVQQNQVRPTTLASRIASTKRSTVTGTSTSSTDVAETKEEGILDAHSTANDLKK